MVLSRSGLLAWFRHAYFEFHSHVRLRFKLAIGLGQPWTRDGGIPQKMSFKHDVYCCIVFALVGIWGRRRGFSLNCMLTISSVFLGILGSSCVLARFTTGYVRLVGQELAPSKCVHMSNFWAVRGAMRGWVVSDEGHRWSVKLDVRDLGGHLDTIFHGWSSTLASRVRLVVSRLVLVFALPLDFHGRCFAWY